MEYLLCTRQDVKAFANMDASQEAYDDLIDSIIRLWTANAKAFCRRNFIFGEYTETYSVIKAGRTMLVRVSEAPITIDEDHPLVITCNGEPVDQTNYLVNKDKGLIRFDLSWLNAGTDNLTITYWGGICVENSDDNEDGIKTIVKHPVRSAVANQCAYALIRTVQNNQGQQSSNEGRSVSNTTPAAMGFLPEVSMVLANYRLNLSGRE